MLDEQGVVGVVQAAGRDPPQDALLVVDETVDQGQGVAVDLPDLADKTLGNAQTLVVVAARQGLDPGGQILVDQGAGELLGLLLSPAGEGGEDLAGLQHAAANDAVAQGNGPGEHLLPFSQEARALMGQIGPRGQKPDA